MQKTEEFIDIEAIRKRAAFHKSGPECYREFQTVGIQYGSSFQTIRELFGSETESLSRLELAAESEPEFGEYGFHPAIIDGAFQTLAGITAGGESGLQLPFALGGMEIAGKLPPVCYAYVTVSEATARIKKYRIRIVDETGRVKITMRDFSVKESKSDRKTRSEMMEIFRRLQQGELNVDEAELLTGSVIL